MKLVTVKSFLLIFFLFSSNCAQVQKTIDQKAKEEEDNLSLYIGKNIQEAFIDFGQPFSDGLNEKGDREVTFKQSKLGIKCIRKFAINEKEIIIGFSSKGCF